MCLQKIDKASEQHYVMKISTKFDETVRVGKSSHPGHKSELEITTEQDILCLNFENERALDNFYRGFLEFYTARKDHYQTWPVLRDQRADYH